MTLSFESWDVDERIYELLLTHRTGSPTQLSIRMQYIRECPSASHSLMSSASFQMRSARTAMTIIAMMIAKSTSVTFLRSDFRDFKQKTPISVLERVPKEFLEDSFYLPNAFSPIFP